MWHINILSKLDFSRNFSMANLPQAHTRAHVDTAHVQNNFSTEQSQTATPVPLINYISILHIIGVIPEITIFQNT
jgi:hypothetical protein